MTTHRLTKTLALFLLAASPVVSAGGSDKDIILKGVIGSAAGTAVGAAVGGSQGAILGSVLGAGAGAALGAHQNSGNSKRSAAPVPLPQPYVPARNGNYEYFPPAGSAEDYAVYDDQGGGYYADSSYDAGYYPASETYPVQEEYVRRTWVRTGHDHGHGHAYGHFKHKHKHKHHHHGHHDD